MLHVRLTRYMQLLSLGVALVALAGCGSDSQEGTGDAAPDVAVDIAGDVPIDIVFDTGGDTTATATAPDSDASVDTSEPPPCAVPGGFGCACTSAGDCLDGACIEGPDGSVCTRNCIEDCPDGFDCLTTSITGSDPVTICVPRHTRLCRPCMTHGDCQNPLDPNPALCVAAADPSDGSFCASSCAQLGCPDGFSCEDVTVGDATARMCMPTGACDCRPAWASLGLTTTCSETNEIGTCAGDRTCGVDGLSLCSAWVPAAEACNLLDDDCNGVTDDVVPAACTNDNANGSCPGQTACSPQGDLVCDGLVPQSEICNGVDDDCNGTTDESWPNCLPSGCNESEGVYLETGAPSCSSGQCAYTNPKPCGLYTCDGGGDAGETCATRCDDDTTCIAAAHCDEVSHTCVGDVVDGGACGDASDCASGHCQNGFCCSGGDCCNQPDDCPDAFRSASVCVNAVECQGARRDAKCVDAVCAISEPIADDSGCGVGVLALDCTPSAARYCSGQPSQSAPVCATSCASDAECAVGYHCDGTCKPDVGNGGSCDEDTDCASEHCENGFCCGAGACCAQAADCPESFRDPAVCLDTVTCQGERIDAVCRNNTCDSQVAQDDSGCDENVEANSCGPFDAVYCSGAASQSAPQCSFSCTLDSECDAGFHCDVLCVPNLPDGNFCDEDTDCGSGHCQNGLCCASGDCCNRAEDCPESYTGVPSCDNTQTCQGSREGPLCTAHICSKVPGQGDDSACTAAVVANDCGPYPSVRCVGGASQNAPACATSCSSNGECDTASYCDPVDSKCKPKKDPGSACTDSAQCGTGHCQNGYCCGSGDCCATKANCSAAIYGTSSVCTDTESCQGEKTEPACGTDFQCKFGLTVGDDSACAGSESNVCGYFQSVFCSAAPNQTAPACRTVCSSDNQCDDGAHCEAPNCVPDQGVGGACEINSQCGSGLTCVDTRCCESTCAGACRRCDVTGSAGICSTPPAGTDPDNDCGAVSCTGYYWGFEGKTCFAHANMAADVVGCGGDGACETAADLCPTAPKGSATVTCHATCQVPASGSCEGTTPGACNNITGGTQTCGVGVCQRTVDKCSDGALATCTPGTGSAEVCDGLDNDCDGLTDAADPDMARIACDNQSGVCAGSLRPASLCVAGSWQPCTDAVYLAYSPRYQAGQETTCDGGTGFDNDCDGAVDEDFTYTGPDGSQVRGANKACGVGVCAGGVTQCGVGNTLVCSKDNLIAAEICDAKDNDCDGKLDSLDPTLTLVACGNQSGVCQGAMTTASLCAAGQWQACTAAQYTANSSAYEGDETLCDGRDNDCNALTDDGLVAPNNTNQLGVCAGTKQLCGGIFGWSDNYGSVAGYGQDETPNGSFLDENCDGIDGDVDLGWFVSATGSGTACTRQAPCALSQALAATGRSQIYMRAGTYSPPGGGTFNLSRAVQIFGGYDASWVRAGRGTNPATIVGGQFGGEAITLRMLNVGSPSTPVVLADVILNGGAPSANGRSSYVIWSKGSRVTVTRSTINAANGATGVSGSSGTNAASLVAPSSGSGGGGASEYTTSCSVARPGGGGGRLNDCVNDSGGGYSRGGDGGQGGAMDSSCATSCPCFGGCCFDYCDNCSASGGFTGGGGFSTGASSDGGGGGGGAGGDTCGGGIQGSPGGASHGAKGAGAASGIGSIASDYFAAQLGGAGGLGSHGGAGGGGGGSGGCDIGTDSTGAGGGGGGAGGCRARAAGTGGGGGGGSFGIFAIDSFFTVQSCVFSRANGGAGGVGGAGAQGQPGGPGGDGGPASGDSAAGGPGGSGGVGGHSGGGGGGAGGPSWGIFWYRSNASAGGMTQSSNDFGVGGGGGAGGSGGPGVISATNGNPGAPGASGLVCELVGATCQ